MATPESVIEIGSTGVRLLVAEFTQERKQNILDRSEVPLSIGKDTITTGQISQETQGLLVQTLLRYKEQLAGWGITPAETTPSCAIKNSLPVGELLLPKLPALQQVPSATPETATL